jgi:alpha-1,6-mannosyltransferase
VLRVLPEDAVIMPRPAEQPLLICDLTQSYSASAGGGISTYLREKRAHILANTPHRLLQIVPGARDRVTVEGRHIWAEVAAPGVVGSPNYRFILRKRAVRALLEEYRPDIVESLCPWLLPWVAIDHRRRFPRTALVAGYRTDFPNAQVYRLGRMAFGDGLARFLRAQAYGYAKRLYREFDWVYTLSESARDTLGQRDVGHACVMPLGADTTLFHPARRDVGFRAELGLGGEGPLLVYAGRIDREKGADVLLAMFRALPESLGAALVMIGDGKLRPQLEAEAAGMRVAFTGFLRGRDLLARALASGDIYVSAMPDETFGVSVLEAQASGLPVVGVASGAMPDRVPPGLGLLGPVGDAAAMAANVVRLWEQGATAIGERARRAAETQCWDRTFALLLDTIYPQAFARRDKRLAGGGGFGEARVGRVDARPLSWSTRPNEANASGVPL